MFYRINCRLAFPDRDSINDILDKVLDHFDDAITINPGQDNSEPSYISIESCYHDENPNRPCEVIEEYTSPDT